MRFVKTAKLAYIVASVLGILVGLLLILWPDSSALFICRVIGVSILLCGGIKLFGYFSNDLYRLAFQYDLALGILTTLLGLLIVIKPGLLSQFIVIITAVYVIINALFTLQTAVEARSFGIRKWWLLLLGAIVSALLGVLLIINPFEGAAMITTLMGVAILFDGIQNLLVAAITVHYRNDDI